MGEMIAALLGRGVRRFMISLGGAAPATAAPEC
jgi:glycerate kinase